MLGRRHKLDLCFVTRYSYRCRDIQIVCKRVLSGSEREFTEFLQVGNDLLPGVLATVP
jgi:hypothetical protein